MMKPVLRAAAVSLALAAAGCAQNPGKAPDRVGKVQFQNSCSPAVQEKLLSGIAMLYSFYYSAAEKAALFAGTATKFYRIGMDVV